VEINRRSFASMGGVAAISSLFPALSEAAQTRQIAAGGDPLVHVAPELRPAARQMLTMSRLPELTDASLPTMRAGGAKFDRPPSADVPVEQHLIPVRAGLPSVRVYVINAKVGERRPGILHTHGGGFILGSAHQELQRLQSFAVAVNCTIVTVEYLLAPEARYTTSVEQNYAGLSWLHHQADAIGVDRSRIAVMGESAGGGHAALLAFAARDRGEVPLVFQLLVYPMLDDRTGSTHQLPSFFGSVGWDPRSNRFGWRALLGMEPGGRSVPAAAVPARRTDLAGLPPTFIGVGGIDLFANEDIEFSRRLLASGVPTELMVVPGAFHGFDAVAADTALAKRFNAAKIDALHRAFSNPL
jgi:acetyl esterase/lipase